MLLAVNLEESRGKQVFKEDKQRVTQNISAGSELTRLPSSKWALTNHQDIPLI